MARPPCCRIEPARLEAGQERFEGEFGLGDRPEPAFFHVQSDGPMLSRYRRDERAQDGAAVRMVVLEAAIRDEVLAWFIRSGSSGPRTVIDASKTNVRSSRSRPLTSGLDRNRSVTRRWPSSVEVLQLDDFEVGREADLLEDLRVFQQDQPRREWRQRH